MGHQYKSTDAIASVLYFHVNEKSILPNARESRLRRNTRTHGNLACGENLLALRLENVSLREPLSDLRAANANPQCKPYGLHCRVRFLVWGSRIITTGRAGGLHQPPWGMSQAEPIGSSKSLPTARLSLACP